MCQDLCGFHEAVTEGFRHHDRLLSKYPLQPHIEKARSSVHALCVDALPVRPLSDSAETLRYYQALRVCGAWKLGMQEANVFPFSFSGAMSNPKGTAPSPLRDSFLCKDTKYLPV